jgi:hypothetical protein
MINTPATTIMIVDLSVEAERLDEFDSFYHDYYIPEFLKAVPEVITARRYVQKDMVTGLDAKDAHYLTLYELSSNDAPEAVETAIARAAHQEASSKFKLWKQDGLTYFDRAFYKEVYRSQRQTEDVCWGDNSLYALRWIVDPDIPISDDEFNCADYFNRQMNNIPAWSACRTYLRLQSDPQSFLTVFEARDQVALRQALADDDETLPEQDQIDFTNWVENSLTWHDCMMFDQIYSFTPRSAARESI